MIMSENIEKPSAGVEPEKKEKKKRRGFAGLLWNQLKILNNIEYFKTNYGQDKYQVLLIATDDKVAALVSVNNGTIDVDGIPNVKEEIKKLKYKGMLKCDTETFLSIAMGKMKTSGYIKMVLKRQIKGISTMLHFAKYFKVIGHEMKRQAAEMKAAEAAKSPETSKKTE